MQFLLIDGFGKNTKIPERDIYRRERDKSSFNEREFGEYFINGTEWDNVIAGGIQSFQEKIMYHLNVRASLIKVSPKEKRLMLKPWITKDILDKCDQRDILLDEMRKDRRRY